MTSTQRHDRLAGNRLNHLPQLGQLGVVGNVQDEQLGRPMVVANAGGRSLHVAKLTVEGRLLVDQHAQDVALHAVLTTDQGDVEGVHAASRNRLTNVLGRQSVGSADRLRNYYSESSYVTIIGAGNPSGGSETLPRIPPGQSWPAIDFAPMVEQS